MPWRFEGGSVLDLENRESFPAWWPLFFLRRRGSGRRLRRSRSGGRRGGVSCRRGSLPGVRLGRLCVRIDPAGVNAAAQRIGRLGVDGSEPDQTTECRLDVTTRASEAIIEIEMTEGRTQVVAPHQNNDAAAEPDAFRISRRTVDDARGFDELVGFARAVLGAVSSICPISCGRLVLVLGSKIAALRDRPADAEQQGAAGNGKATPQRFFKSKQHSTHESPPTLGRRTTLPAMTGKLVPIAARRPGRTILNIHLREARPRRSRMSNSLRPDSPMTEILDFVQQTSRLIASGSNLTLNDCGRPAAALGRRVPTS